MSDGVSTLISALIPSLVGVALWYKLGRLEGRMNGNVRELNGIQKDIGIIRERCPLCPRGTEEGERR